MKKSKKLLIRNIAVLVLSIVMLVVGAGCVYVDRVLGKINYAAPDDTESAAQTGPLFGEGAESGTTNAKAGMLGGLYHDDAVTNILLLGVDDYQKNDIGRSDSMMLVSVDTRHNKLKLTSFMRDLYVAIPGHKSNKLNVAYADGGGDVGGGKLAVTTIEANFGVDIDRFVIVNNKAFNQIIDRLGGVKITLTDETDAYGRTEADLINRYSSDKNKVHTGVNTLSGAQAHYYSRIRAIGDDFERTQRQRKVFESLANGLKSANLTTIYGMLIDIVPLVTTNMTKNEILSMASNSLTYLKYPISQDRIPAQGEYTPQKISGVGDSLVPDLDACRENVVKFIYEDNIPEGTYGE